MLQILTLIATALSLIAIIVMACVHQHNVKNMLTIFDRHSQRMDQQHTRISRLEDERRARRMINGEK